MQRWTLNYYFFPHTKKNLIVHSHAMTYEMFEFTFCALFHSLSLISLFRSHIAIFYALFLVQKRMEACNTRVCVCWTFINIPAFQSVLTSSMNFLCEFSFLCDLRIACRFVWCITVVLQKRRTYQVLVEQTVISFFSSVIDQKKPSSHFIRCYRVSISAKSVIHITVIICFNKDKHKYNDSSILINRYSVW